MTNKLLEAALDYARRGWPVLPLHTPRGNGSCSCASAACESIGKHPRWHKALLPHGLKSATTDEQIIRQCWELWHDANIGVVTGAQSGLMVLDLDGDDGKRNAGELPPSLCSTTGKGEHHWYTHPDRKVACFVGKLPGVDLRADDGYVVAPPSLHYSGRHYAWVTEPDATCLAAPPSWLMDLIESGQQSQVQSTSLNVDNQRAPRGDRYAEAALDGELRALEATAPGERNQQLNRSAFMLGQLVGAGALERGRVEGALEQAALHIGLPLREVQATIQSGMGKGLMQPRAIPFRGNGYTHNSTNSTNSTTASDSMELPEWEPPIPFYDFDLPDFPTDALPGWLRAFVEALAIATQTPPDLAGMLALSACAAACAKKVVVSVKAGYTEPVNLFTVVALPPGNRKSAVFSALVEPLQEYERAEAESAKPLIAEAHAKKKILEERLQKAQSAAAKARADDRPMCAEEATTLARELADMYVPVQPRLIADDATPERLATLLNEQMGRMAVMSPEGDVFDLMAGRYTTNGGSNFGVYLKGHAGDALRVDRVGRPSDFVERPALTLGLAVQPEVLRGLMDKPGFRGRGLLGRFLYALPKSLLGHRNTQAPPVPPRAHDEYRRHLMALLNLPMPTDEQGNIVPHLLQLTPAASDRLQRFEAWVEPQLAEFGELGAITDWSGKLVGAVVRIIGLLHMAKHGELPAPWSIPVELETVEQGIRIGQYATAHARAAYAEMGSDPNIEGACYILAWIERKGCSEFRKVDAFEGTKARFKKAEAMMPALAILVEHGYIRERPREERGGPGRKPSTVYEVNPLWSSYNSYNSYNYLPASPQPALLELVDQPGTEAASSPSPSKVPTVHTALVNFYQAFKSRDYDAAASAIQDHPSLLEERALLEQERFSM